MRNLKYQLIEPDGIVYLYRIDGLWYDIKNLHPTIKRGGGLIIFLECFGGQ